MKKLIILIILVLPGLSSNSQILISLLLGDKLNSDKLEFGIEGGINYSKTTGFESNSYAPFFNMGFYFDIKMKEQLALYTGVLVKSNLGLNKLTTNDLVKLGVTNWNSQGEYRQVINQFMVPVLLKYNFKNHFYIEAGPEFALRYKGFVQFNSEIEGIDARTREDNSEMLQKLDAGVTGGLGYKLLKGEGWTIGVKYYYGFVDAFKDISGTKSSSINLKVNIPIGAGK